MTAPVVLLDGVPVATLEARNAVASWARVKVEDEVPGLRGMIRALVGKRLAHTMMPRRARRAEQRRPRGERLSAPPLPLPKLDAMGGVATTFERQQIGDMVLTRAPGESTWRARFVGKGPSWRPHNRRVARLDRHARRAWVREQGRHDWAMRAAGCPASAAGDARPT